MVPNMSPPFCDDYRVLGPTKVELRSTLALKIDETTRGSLKQLERFHHLLSQKPQRCAGAADTVAWSCNEHPRVRALSSTCNNITETSRLTTSV